jgi:hypothetical protein
MTHSGTRGKLPRRGRLIRLELGRGENSGSKRPRLQAGNVPHLASVRTIQPSFHHPLMHSLLAYWRKLLGTKFQHDYESYGVSILRTVLSCRGEG